MQLELQVNITEYQREKLEKLPRKHCIDILTLLYEQSNEWGRLSFDLRYDTEPPQPDGSELCHRFGVKLAEVCDRLEKLWELTQEDYT